MHHSLDRRGTARFRGRRSRSTARFLEPGSAKIAILLAALLALGSAACTDLTAPAADEATAESASEDEATASEEPAAADEAAADEAAEDEAAGDEAAADEAADDDGAASDAAGDDAADDATADDAAGDGAGAATEEAAAAAAAGELTEAQIAEVLESVDADIGIEQVRSICSNSVLRSLAASQIAASGQDVPDDLLDQVCEVLSTQ